MVYIQTEAILTGQGEMMNDTLSFTLSNIPVETSKFLENTRNTRNTRKQNVGLQHQLHSFKSPAEDVLQLCSNSKSTVHHRSCRLSSVPLSLNPPCALHILVCSSRETGQEQTKQTAAMNYLTQ